MDNYIVSARKYRPATFESVVGQQSLTTTLKNAIVSHKLAHAYLFCGPRGVGKTTCARIFAKTINCFNLTEQHEACNTCESCVAFNEQRSYNIHELDAASNNSVDDIRVLIDQVRIPPQIGKYKVYIIDEVHMLSTSAFNSFLKTLEEPPAHAIFILATTEKHKIIPTILSRCQVYDFNRILISDIVMQLQSIALKEGVTAEPEALNIIAQKADGGMRDALSIFDQVVSYTGGNITYNAVIDNLNVLDYEYYFKLTDAILHESVVDSLLILNDILNRGFEGQHIITGISNHFRDLLVCKDKVTAQLFQVGASIRDRYVATAQQCSNDFLYRALDVTNNCDLNYRISKNKRLMLELMLIKLCQLSDGTTRGDENKNEIKPVQPVKKKNNVESENGYDKTSATISSNTSRSETSNAETNKGETYSAEINSSGQNRLDSVRPYTDIPESTESYLNKSNSIVAETTPDSNNKENSHNEPLANKTFSIKSMGVSLTALKGREDATTSVSENSGNKKNGNRPFTEKDLVEAWRMYSNNLKEEILLSNTMNHTTPRMLSESVFEVMVNTDINKQYLEDSSLSILSYIREKLQNDDIIMTIIVSEENIIKRALTSREIFDEMAEENPALKKLSEEFGLEFD